MTDDEQKKVLEKEAAQVKTDALPSAIRHPSSAPHPDPTRYGDWEINGKCVDF